VVLENRLPQRAGIQYLAGQSGQMAKQDMTTLLATLWPRDIGVPMLHSHLLYFILAGIAETRLPGIRHVAEG
jgi:hypothetical protein